MQVERFETNPLLTTETSDTIGENVNGPSVVRVDDLLDDPLGTYYMYFAHHNGTFIRLAYADDLRGPWTIYEPGTLHLDETQFDHHIASPDVHVDHVAGRIRMYYHGCCGDYEIEGTTKSQVTSVATSTNGIDFEIQGQTLGTSYFRVWEYGGEHYALANDGYLYRGVDPLAPFERLHRLFETNRHFAVRFLDDTTLQAFLTRIGDRPERVMAATVDLERPVEEWRADPHPPETVLWPEKGYEGGDRPLATSAKGSADEPVRELRDPAILEDDGNTYLYHSIAGEQGIAGAEILD